MLGELCVWFVQRFRFRMMTCRFGSLPELADPTLYRAASPCCSRRMLADCADRDTFRSPLRTLSIACSVSSSASTTLASSSIVSD